MTDILKAKTGVGTRQAVNRILAAWGRASEDDILAGKVWYSEAGQLATDLAEQGNVTRETAAVVIAQLSPRTSWTRNVAAARALILGDELPAGTMGDNVRRASAAMDATDPWSTFSDKAHKTRAFAQNILGDPDAVTVDVWACRVAEIDENLLSRVGVYAAAAHAYRLAAKRVGVDPAVMQAVTWCVVRGSAA